MKLDDPSSKDIQTFKEQYLNNELRFPEPKWATSIKEAKRAKIPEHNSYYFNSCHLIYTCELKNLISRLAPYYQIDFITGDLFTKNLNELKLYRLYKLWSSGQKVTPPVIRAFPTKIQTPDLEIIEGNHRIKLSLMNKSCSIPILVENSLLSPNPKKNEWFLNQIKSED
jgi:hypothetical protein